MANSSYPVSQLVSDAKGERIPIVMDLKRNESPPVTKGLWVECEGCGLSCWLSRSSMEIMVAIERAGGDWETICLECAAKRVG